MVMSITPKQFLELLQPAEVVAVMTSDNPSIIYFRTLFLASERVRGDDASLMEGLEILKQHQLLSAGTLASIKQRMNIALP